MLNATRPYILKGKVEEAFGAITMTVNWIGFLDRYKSGRSQTQQGLSNSLNRVVVPRKRGRPKKENK